MISVEFWLFSYLPIVIYHHGFLEAELTLIPGCYNGLDRLFMGFFLISKISNESLLLFGNTLPNSNSSKNFEVS